jgi:hypothetical protein
MDETGVLLSVLNSLKFLVGRNELKTYKGAGVKHTFITAIECISADGHSPSNYLVCYYTSEHWDNLP